VATSTNETWTFGALLRKHRLAASFSQKVLAARARLSVNAVAALERGRRSAPRPGTVVVLADALSLTSVERAALISAATAARLDVRGRPEGVSPPRVLSDLPAALTSFIGRRQELTEIERLLGTTRLLTLIGAGGAGKTRLARRMAEEVAHRYADGVWLVDLAPLADTRLVTKAVASALGVQEQARRSLVDTLVDTLRGRELLILLDNCEHLVQACAELTEALLGACPRIGVLATSRQALRIAGETVYRVPSLQLPALTDAISATRVSNTEAVQLFVDRAQAVRPGFVLNNLNAVAVVQVCRRLDGIPLALELAAARLSALSVHQIAARLDDRFRLLTEGNRTALPRQQTLRSMLDWSHDLLSGTERILLRRLAVFSGGWTLEAAEVVSAGDGLEPGEVLDLLAQLVGKSLVVVESHGPVVRYRLLETVRQYAREKLRLADEEDRLCRRQRDWCLALVEEAEPQLYRAEQVHWLDQLELEYDNLRVALAWSHAQSDGSILLAPLARALWRFWYLRGHLTEGRRWLDEAVSGTERSSVRGGALLGAGWLAYGHGELERASDLLEHSVSIAHERGDRQTAAHALMALSFTWRDRGDHQRSRPLLDESLAISREIGFRWGEAFSLYLMAGEATWRGDLDEVAECCTQSLPVFRELGERLGLAYALQELARLAFNRHEYARATELYHEGLVLSRELGNRRGICFSLDGLARVARRRGEYAGAAALLAEALGIWRELGNRQYLPLTLTGLAALAADLHQPRRSARLFGAAEAQLEAIGATLPERFRNDTRYDQAVALVRQELGQRAFAAAWVAGRAMTRDQAIDEALAAPGLVSSRSKGVRDGGLASLSSRECQVAALVAQGHSNREIGAALVITARTADTHVGHILAKLNMHTRAQIAAWVAEQGSAIPRRS
jgi:predicted ATPase/DNA-binding CsgD family transcriptional regulator